MGASSAVPPAVGNCGSEWAGARGGLPPGCVGGPLSGEAVRCPRLRVGCTPGLRDEPVYGALCNKCYGSARGVHVEHVFFPPQLDAVAAMLGAGVVDVALMFSEDAVAHAAANRLLRICGTLAAAPRRFVLLAPVAALPSHRRATDTVAVAAGLCPRLALALLGDELGWGRAPPAVAEMSSAADALDALLWRLDAQAVLWEDSPALRSLVEGICDVLTEVTCPWPTHLFVTSTEACRRKMGCVREVVGHTALLCEEFKANVQNNAIERLGLVHGLPRQGALDLLASGAWSCSSEVDVPTAQRLMGLLVRLGLLPAESFELRARSLLAPGACRRGGGARGDGGCGEEAAEEDPQAPPLPAAGAAGCPSGGCQPAVPGFGQAAGCEADAAQSAGGEHARAPAC